MSFRILQLKDLDISFKQKGNDITLSFVSGHIKKTMDDAADKTLWSQDGYIEFREIDNLEVYQILNEKVFRPKSNRFRSVAQSERMNEQIVQTVLTERICFSSR